MMKLPPLVNAASPQGDIIPPENDRWVAARIYDLAQQPDGTFSGKLEMATIAYHIRGYRKEGREILMDFQPMETVQGRAQWLDYVTGLGRKMGSG